jgi:hypothetical protein
MPFCGTFSYVVTIPGTSQESGSPWPVSLAEKFELTGESIQDDRLLGHSPTLAIADGGTVFPQDKRLGEVVRSRFTLTASRKKHATLSSAAFYVDRNITSLLKPGDLLYLSRTSCAGLALSLLRNDELILAAGAVTAVHLGRHVKVMYPLELVREAEGVFRKSDPTFEFAQTPLLFHVGTESRIVFGGSVRLGDYKILVRHGHIAGTPGTEECAAIWTADRDARPAACSAELLESGGLEMRRW